jgi:hypothetical protein
MLWREANFLFCCQNVAVLDLFLPLFPSFFNIRTFPTLCHYYAMIATLLLKTSPEIAPKTPIFPSFSQFVKVGAISRALTHVVSSYMIR